MTDLDGHKQHSSILFQLLLYLHHLYKEKSQNIPILSIWHVTTFGVTILSPRALKFKIHACHQSIYSSLTGCSGLVWRLTSHE